MYDISSLANKLLKRPERGGSSFSDLVDQKNEFKDLVFGVAFLVNILILSFYGYTVGIQTLNSIKYISYISITGTSQSKSHESSADIVGGAFLALSLGYLFSMIIVLILAKLSHHIINTVLISTGVVGVVAGVSLFTADFLIGGIFMILLAVFCGLFYLYMKRYILFASAILKTACLALQDLPSVFLFAALVLILQAYLCLIWLFAVIGTSTNEANTSIYANGVKYSSSQCSTYSYSTAYTFGNTTLTCNPGHTCYTCICGGNVIASSSSSCFHEQIYGFSYFFWILSLFWICSVAANVLHCTVAASVSRWWSNANHQTFEIVQNSFIRAITYNFGSICFGSLLVAFIRTLRVLVQAAKYSMEKLKPKSQFISYVHRTILWMLEYVLNVIGNVMEYFNHYAFCFVAMYGYGFLDSSKAAVALFRDRGWTAIINDDIIDYVLTVANMLVGILCTLFILWYCQGKHISNVNSTLLLVLAYNCGHFMSAVTTGIISSSVSTIFVCFAERTDIFRLAHPKLYHELFEVWKAVHPESAPAAESAYVPPHLIDNSGTITSGSYKPVFSGDDSEGDVESLTPTKAVKTKAGVIISGKFNVGESRSNDSERANRLINQFSTYFKSPQSNSASRQQRAVQIQGAWGSPATATRLSTHMSQGNVDDGPPIIYDNADESTLF